MAAIKVQAISMGYYNHKRQRAGSVFMLVDKMIDVFANKDDDVKIPIGKTLWPAEEQFSARWMKKIKSNIPITPFKKTVIGNKPLGPSDDFIPPASLDEDEVEGLEGEEETPFDADASEPEAPRDESELIDESSPTPKVKGKPGRKSKDVI